MIRRREGIVHNRHVTLTGLSKYLSDLFSENLLISGKALATSCAKHAVEWPAQPHRKGITTAQFILAKIPSSRAICRSKNPARPKRDLRERPPEPIPPKRRKSKYNQPQNQALGTEGSKRFSYAPAGACFKKDYLKYATADSNNFMS